MPETANALKLNDLLREKAKLEFIRVAARSPEQWKRLIVVAKQCEELELQVLQEEIDAKLANQRMKIKEMKAYLRHTAPRRGMRMAAATQKRRAAARVTIEQLQAEIIPFAQAKTEVNGVAKVNELTMLNRCQFLKMIGMTMLSLSIWNEAVAGSGYGTDMMALGSSASSWFISWAISNTSGLSADGGSVGSYDDESTLTTPQKTKWRASTVFCVSTPASTIALTKQNGTSTIPIIAKVNYPANCIANRDDSSYTTFSPYTSTGYADCVSNAMSIFNRDLKKCYNDYIQMYYQIHNNMIYLEFDATKIEVIEKSIELTAETLITYCTAGLVSATLAKNARVIADMTYTLNTASEAFSALAASTDEAITSGLLDTIDTAIGVAIDHDAAAIGAGVMGSMVGGLAAGVVAQVLFSTSAYNDKAALIEAAIGAADGTIEEAADSSIEIPVINVLNKLREFYTKFNIESIVNDIAENAYGPQDPYGIRNAFMNNEKANVGHLIAAVNDYANALADCDTAFLS